MSESPLRAPGEQPMFASPASENPSTTASCTYKAWRLQLENECSLDDYRNAFPFAPELIGADAEWMALFDRVENLRLRSGGPSGLGYIQLWMLGMEKLLRGLWASSHVHIESMDTDVYDLQRRVRGLRHEHNARVRAAQTHSSLLDKLQGTVRQLQQQLNSFAAATVAVLEAEAGGGTTALREQCPRVAPSGPSPAAAAAGPLAATPGAPSAAAAPHAAPAADAAAHSHPHPPQPPACTQWPPPAVAANKILLRGASCAQAEAMARGDFSALGLGEGPLGMYERRWRANSTGRVWNVEVVVTRDQRAAFIRAAAQIKHTAGMTVAPYLTPEGRAARRARQAQFNSLVEQGLQPYWRGTDIVTEEGDRRCVHTMQ